MKIAALAALALLLVYAAHTSQAAVLGIDLGSDYVKAALVAPGVPFTIVVDEMTKRKQAALVGFDGVGDAQQRVFGNNAASLVRARISSCALETRLIRKPWFSSTLALSRLCLFRPALLSLATFVL